MKAKNEFEMTYAKVVKECVALLNQEADYEKKKIALALEIGKKVDELLNLSQDDKDRIIKRLSRDISKERGKVISQSKIEAYQQLYLNFKAMDVVTSMEKSLMNDITVDMLTEMTLKDKQLEGKSAQEMSPLLSMLKKAHRILDRFEVLIKEKQPEDDVILKISTELQLIEEKSRTIINTLNNGGKQQNLLKICNAITTVPRLNQ